MVIDGLEEESDIEEPTKKNKIHKKKKTALVSETVQLQPLKPIIPPVLGASSIGVLTNRAFVPAN